MQPNIFQIALAHHKASDLDAAEKGYREILDHEPQNVEVLHLLGILLAQKKDFNEARKLVERALKKDRYSALLHNSLGNILKNLHEYKDAIFHYQQALHLQSESASAHNNLGTVFYLLNQLESAEKHYRAAIKLRHDYGDAYFNLALVLTKKNATEDAIECLKMVIKLQPQHSEAHHNIAQILQLRGEFTQAARHYQIALRLDRDNFQIHHGLGVVLVAQEKYAAAVRHFKKVLLLQPDFYEALHNLGAIFLKQNNPQVALKYFLRLTEIAKDFDAYYNLGVIYMDLGRLNDAIVYFNEALNLNSKDVKSHTNLGAIYLRLENHIKAAEHYKYVLSLEPNNGEVVYILDALEQKNTVKIAPREYVQNLFDQYAQHYEQHLKFLEYNVPQFLYDAVNASLGEENKELRILDLGCGTGLCGEKFHKIAKTLIGVDVSEKMLEKAREKAIYTELKIGSIVEALCCYRDLDLIFAADTFVYIGDLADIFVACAKSLAKNGIFAFTVEKTTDYPYILQRSARFAHSEKYIVELAQKNAFILEYFNDVVLRKQQNTFVAGLLFLLRHQ